VNLIFAQITSNDNLLLGIITTAGGAMAAAIVHLYFRDSTKSKDLVDMVSKEFTECKKDRDELRKLYYELNGKFSTLGRD
jgi:hypothetical protein